MAATIGSFKGHPTISLTNGTEDRFPFSMGVNKAKLVLANLDAIRAFVARHDTTPRNIDPMGVDKAYDDSCKAACGL